MPSKSYCIVHLKGHYGDFEVVSVSGLYSKNEAKQLSDEFGSKSDGVGNWEVKQISKYGDDARTKNIKIETNIGSGHTNTE